MAFQKGHTKLGGRKKGSLNKETLSKLQARAVFNEKISQKWEETIDKLPATYIADQFMGTAMQKLEVDANVKNEVNLTPELIELAKEELKKRMKDGK
jgi:hypothetical protein